MAKRWMIFNPIVNQNTFVFLFWKGDAATTLSWSVRDYSIPGLVKLRRRNDFPPELTPESILSSAVYKFTVTSWDVNDYEYWFKKTQQFNDKYLRQSLGATSASYVGNAPPAPQQQPNLITPSSHRFGSNSFPAFFVPTIGAEDWRRLLADPEKQWREGFSAKTLAERWNAAKGFPSEVAAALATSTTFRGIEFLCGFPEHKVPLPGGERASQNDIFVLARTLDSLVSITVEGKVEESFGPILSEWATNASDGKVKRLQFLLETIGLPGTIPGYIRYQLLHRTASAIIEAHRFHARHAILLVHSFSPRCTGFDDYSCFVSLYGQQADANSVTTLAHLGTVTLHSCWVEGLIPSTP